MFKTIFPLTLLVLLLCTGFASKKDVESYKKLKKEKPQTSLVLNIQKKVQIL